MSCLCCWSAFETRISLRRVLPTNGTAGLVVSENCGKGDRARNIESYESIFRLGSCLVPNSISVPVEANSSSARQSTNEEVFCACSSFF
jgi:hypothetical protein